MHDRPASWLEAELGVLIQRIEAGLNVKCEERPPENGERGLVKISAVTWGRFDEQQSKTLPLEVDVDDRNRIRPGDLLLSRANTIELVGASVIVGSIGRTLYLSDKVLRLVVDEQFKRWINYALKTPWMRQAIEDASSGNQLSMRNLSQDKLRGLPIPVAPAAEQQRIADKLDTVLARVDACRDRLARVAPLLKRFRQSVLAAASSGQLTSDWRAPATAEWTQYPSVAISSVASARLGKMLDKEKNSGTPVRYLRNVNVRWFKFDLEDLLELRVEQHELEDLSIRDGDVLICEGGEPGRCAVWSGGPTSLIFQKALHRVRPDATKLSSPWLAYCLKHLADSGGLSDSFTGSTIQHLTGVALAKVQIPLPPIDEQTEIVRRVETLFAFADRLQARLVQAQTAVARLTPALLAKAFRGELVPQDPADEPATALLQRLAQARPATAAKPRRSQLG